MQMLRSVTGAGVGALIAKFVLGAGTTGTAIGGLIGAVMGRKRQSTPRNFFGQSVDGNNVYGNPF